MYLRSKNIKTIKDTADEVSDGLILYKIIFGFKLNLCNFFQTALSYSEFMKELDDDDDEVMPAAKRRKSESVDPEDEDSESEVLQFICDDLSLYL